MKLSFININIEMKRFFLYTFILLGLSATYAFTTLNASKALEEGDSSNVKWMTWEQAIAQQQKDKKEGKAKKIFVDIYTDWCGWCKKMDKETFQQPAISKYLNAYFYPVKFNAEQKEDINFGGKTFKFVANGRRGYHELAASLLDGKMSYPTVIFLNEDVQLLQRIPGYLNVPTFDMILHYLAEEHFKTTPWATFQQQYQEKQTAGKSEK